MKTWKSNRNRCEMYSVIFFYIKKTGNLCYKITHHRNLAWNIKFSKSERVEIFPKVVWIETSPQIYHKSFLKVPFQSYNNASTYVAQNGSRPAPPYNHSDGLMPPRSTHINGAMHSLNINGSISEQVRLTKKSLEKHSSVETLPLSFAHWTILQWITITSQDSFTFSFHFRNKYAQFVSSFSSLSLISFVPNSPVLNAHTFMFIRCDQSPSIICQMSHVLFKFLCTTGWRRRDDADGVQSAARVFDVAPTAPSRCDSIEDNDFDLLGWRGIAHRRHCTRQRWWTASLGRARRGSRIGETQFDRVNSVVHQTLLCPRFLFRDGRVPTHRRLSHVHDFFVKSVRHKTNPNNA